MTGREVFMEYPPCSTCGFVERIEVFDMGEWQPDAESAAEEAAWQVHLLHTTRETLSSTPIDVLRQRHDVSEIRQQFGQWAVTTYGVECLTDCYAIARKRVFEQDWIEHMSGKTWVLLEDFQAALLAARRLYTTGISPRRRFLIMKRDQYRCQLCGITAAEGTRLQVDHKTARVKGGSNADANLWTLCWECNIGKATDDL